MKVQPAWFGQLGSECTREPVGEGYREHTGQDAHIDAEEGKIYV